MRSSLVHPACVVLAAVACGPGGSIDTLCDGDTIESCNLDQQIDGEDGTDAFVSESVRQCVTAEGKTYVAWVDDRKGSFVDVYLNASNDGSTWFPAPIQVKQGNGDAANLDLACAGDFVWVVWEDTRDSETDYQNIYFNFSSDGGVTWRDEDRRLDDDEQGRSISINPRLAVGGGAVHVVWADQLLGAPDIYIATSPNGNANFEPPQRISGDPTEPGQWYAGNPRAVAGQNGIVHVVWEDTRNAGLDPETEEQVEAQDIFYTRYDPSEPAGDAGTPDDPSDDRPQVRLTKGAQRGGSLGFAPSIDSSDTHVYVAWHDTRSGDGTDIFYNYSGNGGRAWLEEAARLESDAPGAAESRSASVVATGDVGHVVWSDSRDGGYDVYYRPIIAGVPSEDEEIRLDVGDGRGDGNSLAPQLAHRDGTFVVAWQDGRAQVADGLADVLYNHITLDEEGDGRWDRDDFRLTSPQAGTSFVDSVNVAVADGFVYASWVDFRDGKNDPDVFFAKVEVGDGIVTFEDLQRAGLTGP